MTGECVELKNKKTNSLKNKIVLIKNADPGYDYIFNNKIKGLITQYGGSNSHMAIRCLELNIPASIGVGKLQYENLKKSKKIVNHTQNQLGLKYPLNSQTLRESW